MAAFLLSEVWREKSGLRSQESEAEAKAKAKGEAEASASVESILHNYLRLLQADLVLLTSDF